MRKRDPLDALLALGIAASALFCTSLHAEPDRAFERRVERTGQLQLLIADDFVHGRSHQELRFSDDSSGRSYALRFNGPPPEGLTRSAAATVRGLERDGEILVDPGSDGLVVLSAATTTDVTGPRSVAVIIVDFYDEDVGCSDDEIESLMFGAQRSVDGLYREASFQQMSFPGGIGVVQRVSIGASAAGSCAPLNWAGQAHNKAVIAGVNMSSYQHHLFVLPAGQSCPWTGLGQVGCDNGCLAWADACYMQDVYAHELGHNLGLYHASRNEGNSAVEIEYGDHSDFMGAGRVGWRHLNGPHKKEIGWLPSEKIATAWDGQIAVLSALDMRPIQTPFPQLLRVLVPDHAPYYLSYRRRAGYDFELEDEFPDRVSVHAHPGDGGNTFLLRTFGDGEVFHDGTGQVRITQLSHDATSATLQIETVCEADPPFLTSALAEQAGLPGQSLSYSIDVLNGDRYGCPPAEFTLAAGLPTNWSATMTPASLTLAPGDSATAMVTLHSASGEPDGPMEVEVLADDAAKAGHAAGLTLTFVVEDAPLEAPTDLGVGILRERYAYLSWSPGIGATGYRIYRDGQRIGDRANESFIDWNTGDALRSYHVTSVDAAGRESAASDAVQLSWSGSGRVSRGRRDVRLERVGRGTP